MKRVYLFFLALILVVSCNEQKEPDPAMVGYNFFPLETGQYIDYNVITEEYTLEGDLITTNYQLRQQVVDSFVNGTGSLTYILYRYKRPDDSAPWTFLETWSARLEANRAVTIEGTIPYDKISFPVKNGRTWDGNSLNTMDEDSYKIDSLNDEIITDQGESLSTLTVVQEDLLDFIIGEEDRRYERYARGIGLIEKEERRIFYCTSGACNESGIETGMTYHQTLQDYGRE